jgi:serine/threonine-protein kinase
VIGTRLGSYEIVEQLGAGGMGAVYVARHHLLGRRAAVKVLLPELCGRREAVERFFDEARAISAVPDAGVVQIFDYGHDDAGNAYLVMELLEGESLEARLQRVGRLSAADAVRVVRQAAMTLARAHAAGVVHRDIKPDNLFLVGDMEAEAGERVKVLDFGIAKLADGGPHARSRTSTGVVVGTPLYMSPEQCRGHGGIDHRADIYALGCVLFRAVAGRPPFDAEGAGEILMMHMMTPPPRPSDVVVGVPPDLDAIVLRCLAKDVNERYATAAELASDLGALSARLTGRAHVVSIQPTVIATPAPTTLGLARGSTPVPAVARRRAGAWLSGIAAVVIAGGAIAFVAGRGATSVAPADDDASSVTMPAATAPPPADAGMPPVDAAVDAPPVPEHRPTVRRPHHRSTTSSSSSAATPSTPTTSEDPYDHP